MNLIKESPLTKILFREPKDPKLPPGFLRSEKLFDKGDKRNLGYLDLRAEKQMNEARKKLEKKNFEDSLVGEAREKAREKRLERKRSKELFMKKLNTKR